MLDEEAENGGARLSEAEIDAIAERLRRGQYLDDHYRSALFRQAKEYELTYAAKQSRGQILAEEVVPLLVEL